jgi:DNA repair protein RecO
MHQTEAVVLQAIPFKEYDRILTLFSPSGLLKLFLKSSKRNYLHTAALASPFTCADFHFTPGRKDLHRFEEGNIVNQHLSLRMDYETFLAAESMIHNVLRSQSIGKPAPKLYILFRMFLEHLPSNPSSIATAFSLKIMLHEGILQLGPLQATERYAGEITNLVGAISFSPQEEEWLTALTLARSLSQITNHQLPGDFRKKIEALLTQAFE